MAQRERADVVVVGSGAGGSTAHDGSSVVDENGRVWAYDNLYVAGTAVLAQANAGNPTIACIAAALRTVDAIAGHV